MADSLEKLRPDRDLQCYFQQPSSIAALSGASASGFTVSGSWRLQSDWAVVEWNRDNVFEHPGFRNLPDGDLSGLALSYEETRTNCIPMDSDLYWAVEWPFLRVWLEGDSDPRLVRLRDYATPIEGSAVAATAVLELEGTPNAGDYIGAAWQTEQYYYIVTGTDTLATAAAGLAANINAGSSSVQASAAGAQITLTSATPGANWNRIGVYGYVSGACTEQWQPWYATFSGGVSPSKWRVDLNFGNLTDKDQNPITTTAVRKMRWTYAADLQAGAFQRGEFQIQVGNWTVTGTNRAYSVAGPESVRIEDAQVAYTGSWTEETGNYSGGTIHWTATSNSALSCAYRATAAHTLYLGALRTQSSGQVSIVVDGGAAMTRNLAIDDNDVLVRMAVGNFGAGDHTVSITFTGPQGSEFYFDFLEMAEPSAELPAIDADQTITLATDWDTYHSLCLAPERTAWMIHSLGFHGRQNHYAGALWFFEMALAGQQYASGTVEFSGTPTFGYGLSTTVTVGTLALTHVHYIGDTAETVAKAFELEINSGYLQYWASAPGDLLTIYSRDLAGAGTQIGLQATSTCTDFHPQASGATLAGGNDGSWTTDLAATPRLNRAARDWNRAFFTALKGYGMDATAALSMELQFGDPSAAAGIAQRCPAGEAVVVNTPALQTNFSPTSIGFWEVAYHDLAQTMQDAGLQPYLQFGEVQWWYFRNSRSGMPYYDDYTKAAFQSQYGRAIDTISDETAPVSSCPDEAAFLPTLVGSFTNQVMAYVRQSFPNCRFEVLYPLDVNATPLDQAVNYPGAAWTPQALDCLKTESFGYTGGRDLDKCLASILLPQSRGFAPHQSAHLIGISDPVSPWLKEMRLAKAAGVGSVVLFALDQFCLIGYSAPLPGSARRSGFQG
jgi:hypothetical protein